MSRRQRLAADIRRNRAPVAQRREQAVDDALGAPQREQRTAHLAARSDIRVVVLEVDRRRGAIVLARRVNGCRRGKAALVFGQRARIEMLESGSQPAHHPVKIERGIGADHPLRNVERAGSGRTSGSTPSRTPGRLRGTSCASARCRAPRPARRHRDDRRTADARRGRRGRDRRGESAGSRVRASPRPCPAPSRASSTPRASRRSRACPSRRSRAGPRTRPCSRAPAPARRPCHIACVCG